MIQAATVALFLDLLVVVCLLRCLPAVTMASRAALAKLTIQCRQAARVAKHSKAGRAGSARTKGGPGQDAISCPGQSGRDIFQPVSTSSADYST